MSKPAEQEQEEQTSSDSYVVELRKKQRAEEAVLREHFPDYESLLKIAAAFVVSSWESDKQIRELESLLKEYHDLAYFASFSLKNNSKLARDYFEKARKEFSEKLPDLIAIGAAIQSKSMAKKAAKARIENDPKQYAKEHIYLAWKDWQAGTQTYGKRNSQAAFASAMREKWDVIESVRSIENWCRDWKNGKNIPLIEPAQ